MSAATGAWPWNDLSSSFAVWIVDLETQEAENSPLTKVPEAQKHNKHYNPERVNSHSLGSNPKKGTETHAENATKHKEKAGLYILRANWDSDTCRELFGTSTPVPAVCTGASCEVRGRLRVRRKAVLWGQLSAAPGDSATPLSNTCKPSRPISALCCSSVSHTFCLLLICLDIRHHFWEKTFYFRLKWCRKPSLLNFLVSADVRGKLLSAH